MWGVDVWIHVLLTSALVAGEWPISRSGRESPRADLYDVEKRQFFTLPGHNSDPSVVQPVASCYTVCAILTHTEIYKLDLIFQKITDRNLQSVLNCWIRPADYNETAPMRKSSANLTRRQPWMTAIEDKHCVSLQDLPQPSQLMGYIYHFIIILFNRSMLNVLGSHGGHYSDCGLLGCDTVKYLS
jgi:hypothetical protein